MNFVENTVLGVSLLIPLESSCCEILSSCSYSRIYLRIVFRLIPDCRWISRWLFPRLWCWMIICCFCSIVIMFKETHIVENFLVNLISKWGSFQLILTQCNKFRKNLNKPMLPYTIFRPNKYSMCVIVLLIKGGGEFMKVLFFFFLFYFC